MRAAALLLVVAACGDNLPDPATPRSGERLKLGWYIYDDGTRQRETAWYFDRALDTTCTARAWSDGNHYCAPATGEAVYVGDACTQALGRAAAGTEPPTYFATSFYVLGQGSPSRVFRRGAPVAAPFTIFEKHSNGCFGPMTPADGFDYYELGEEITDLVQLRHSAPRGQGDLVLVDEVSDDGLHVPIAYYDRTLEVECTPAARANVESIECVPNDSRLASFYDEVGCIEPKLVITDGSVPTTAKHYSPATRCWSYYDVGAEVGPEPLYESRGGTTCFPASPPVGADFYIMAGPHQTQGLLRERESSTRRLAGIDLVRENLRIADSLLYDTQLHAECERDASLRCVPATEATIEPFFSDAGCTKPLDLALVPAGSCDPPTKFARKGDAYHPLQLRFTQTIYWLSTGDTCGIYGPPVPFEAWTVGPALDPATFSRAELVIDP